MGLFDKLFRRNKEQEEQKVALDEGLKKTKEGFLIQIEDILSLSVNLPLVYYRLDIKTSMKLCEAAKKGLPEFIKAAKGSNKGEHTPLLSFIGKVSCMFICLHNDPLVVHRLQRVSLNLCCFLVFACLHQREY